MRYALVLPDLSIGGAQRVLLTYARQLSLANEVTLFIISSQGGLKDEVDDRIKIVSLSNRSLNLALQVKFISRLPHLISKGNFDLVFSTLFQLNVVLGLLKRVRLLRSKLVLREANFVSIEWPKSRVYFIFRFFGPIAYRSADAVICLNEVQLNDVRKFLQINGRRLHILPNPVFGDLIRSVANEASSEELRYERPILLSVGRLEKQKRLDVLLESFFKFRCNHGSGTLLIVGAGSLEGDLKKWVSENDMSHNVIFLGEVKNPFPIFKEADLYVLTSDFEGLPNSLIQGCFLTRRVVATDCKSGPSSILNGYEGGMLAQTGDVDGLVKAYNVMLGHAKVLPSDEWIDRYSEEGSFNKLLRIFSCVGL